jgi:protein tyrosine phosphatase (PTP) superfamily phosphohydrolase (DUF442 family)
MLEDIKNFYRISESLATSAQPSAEQFHDIKEEGFDVVINLARDDSPGAIADEAAIVESLNMDYIHIPVDFDAPVLSDLKRFFATMDRYHINNIFVHCACNWRVAAFVFLYRTIRCDVPVAMAIRDLHAVWQPDDTWQAFIDSVLDHYNIDR